MSSLHPIDCTGKPARVARFLRPPVPAALIAALVIMTLASAVPAVARPPFLPGIPVFSDASVHDPSVIKVDDRYYVFGSHGASAWTEDLMNWNLVASTVNSGNPPHFDTFQSELSELIEWTNAETLWAADVIQLADGRFYYYYNVWTDHLSYRSYMGLAVADHVEGPYTDLGEIMRAGTGIAGFDPAIHPNTIDPALFFDAANRLWMVYGSYSGGIFILEMNPTTGFPLPGQGWGRKLLGGQHQLIEGPFIEYNPDTGYYYLFLSYGGLGANDGYNMRVFRSQNPDGPYFDPSGTNMSNPGAGSYTDHGLMLASNWQFLPVEGELSTTTGYRSPGHNSVFRDPATGEWFNFFHTRFVGRGEEHELRVHQLYFNEKGWPVMAPHAYAGGSTAHQRRSDVPGEYKLIIHDKAISGAVNTSSVVTFEPNGKITGAVSGRWHYRNGDHIELQIDGQSYSGVFSTEWDDDQAAWVYGFSAQSDEGLAVWGSQPAVSQHRTREVELPERAALYGHDFYLALPRPAGNPHYVYSYVITEGPSGLSVDRATGILSWRPMLGDVGECHSVTVRAFNTAPDRPQATEYSFDLSTYSATRVERIVLDFNAPGSGGLLDADGLPTGFTTRLPGTGEALAAEDPLLHLDPAAGLLNLQTTQADFAGGAGLDGNSMPGISLADLGFGGDGDFAVTVRFQPLLGLELIDQVGLYVGTSQDAVTRAGTIVFDAPEFFSAHSENGVDHSARFFGFGLDASDGMDVTITRENGLWSYYVDGVPWAPLEQPAFLDGQSDLHAGVFGITPLNGNSKTIVIDDFSVILASDEAWLSELEQWRILYFAQLAPTGIAADHADPDRDRRHNLQEFKDGTNPLVAD